MTIARITFAAAAAAAALAAGTGTARADGPPPVTFHATGAPQTATVPDDAVAVRIAMTGGSGGSILHVDGGRGAAVTGYTRVTGGEKLTVDVGAAGTNDGENWDDQPGGWGYTTGGTGVAPYRNTPGAGGGGSSAVLRGDRPLAVAGGGGGSGGAGTQLYDHLGGRGGDAGAVPDDGASIAAPGGAGGKGGAVLGGNGASSEACTGDEGGGGGGGGGGADGAGAGPTWPDADGGGAAGGCGQFSSLEDKFFGGGGGGAGVSVAPAGSTITTATSAGDGAVTLTWYTSTSLTCGDPALQLIDSTTTPHTIDASTLCSGTVPIASYELTGETGVGRFRRPDSADGRLTYEVDRNQTGIGAATARITDAIGDARTVRLTFLAAPGEQLSLTSHGMAVDALNGDFGREVVAEPPASAPGQRWQLADGGGGRFYLVNAAQGNCLTTTDLAERPGTTFELAGCGVAVSDPIRIAATADATALTLTDAISGLPLAFQSTGPGGRLVLGDASDGWAWAPASATPTPTLTLTDRPFNTEK